MSTTIEIDDIIASIDIAIMCGVGSAAVSNWKDRHPSFPKPFKRVANGHTELYRKSEIVEWYRNYKVPEEPEIFRLLRGETT